MKVKYLFRITIVLLLSLFPYLSYGQIMKHVEFKITDMVKGSVLKKGTIYDYVSLKNTQPQNTLGNPDLPVLRYRFYIPVNQKAVSVIFNSVKQDVIQLTNDLIPVQKPLLTSWNAQDTTFIMPNKLVYKNSNAYPAIQARITNTDYLDGDLELVTIEVCPMQYYPTTKKVLYSSQFDLKIETATDDNSTGKKVHPKKRMREVMSILKSVVVNPELASADSSAIVIKSTGSSSKIMAKVGTSTNTTLPYYEYVIITDASLVSGFTDFINWKKRKGINIGIVTTNDIYANYTGDIISNPAINDNPGKVRQYLKDSHSNGGPISWALIAGDYNTNVPIRIKYDPNDPQGYYYFPTDAYFCDLSNNWADGYYPKSLPDIYVGRLICSNTTDINNWTRKVLLYEQNPGNGDYSYLLKSFSIEADQLQDGSEAEGVSYHFPTYFPKNWGENPSSYATYDSNGYSGSILGTTKGADVINEMKNHYGLFGWFCHGGSGRGMYQCSPGGSNISTMTSETNGSPSWALCAEDANEYCSPYRVHETGNGLDNLNNANYPSILYSNSCDVTPFDITSNNNNGGARNCGEAFTVFTQTGGVAFLGNTKYGLVWSSSEINKKFGDLIYSNDYCSHIGVADFLSKQSNYNLELYYSHNLIGCPETQMWTASPTKFSSATVTKNGSTVTVSTGSVNNCIICVMSSSDNGSSYFQVDTLTSGKTFNNVPSPYYVTITKHNYIPYMYSSDSYIQNETFIGIQTINANNVTAGSNVTTSKPTGPVIIQSGANVTINADGTTILNNSFEVQSGGVLEIK